jgi:F-type H+-transporting ATPase subunit b
VGSFATILLAATEPTVEAAEKVNNPILPVGNELFWAALCFGLLWILMKFVLLPPVLKGMDNRDAKVRGDLEAAESAKTEAETSLADYQASLVSTKAQAIRTIEDARVAAEADRRQKLASAEGQAAEVRAAAAQEVVEAKATAKVQLQSGLTNIVLDAADAVVQRPVDRTTQTQVIEDFVNRAGSSS